MMRNGLLIAVFALVLASPTVQAKKAAVKAVSPTKAAPVTLPAGDELFPAAPYAELADKSCLGCHSADTVLNQPALPEGTWLTEVDKMRTVYKAPIAPEEIDALVAYLTSQQGINRPHWR